MATITILPLKEAQMDQEDKGKGKGDIEIKKPPASEGGIKVVEQPTEIKPPLEEGEPEPCPEEIEPGRVTGKIPLSPAVIKPPLRFEGMVLAEMTGYPGWLYTEEDLEDIAELIRECGWEMDPRIQILLSLVTIHGAKFTGYMAWKRTGRKGDLRKVSSTGELDKTTRPSDEKVIQ